MFEMVQLLAGTNLALLAFSVLIFDIPRYTLSLLSLALFGVWRRSDSVPAGKASVSVIIPTFNGGSGARPHDRFAAAANLAAGRNHRRG